MNRLARQLATERQTCISGRAARLFAHVGMALFDTYVAVWDAKYAATTTGAPTPRSGRRTPTATPRTSPEPALGAAPPDAAVSGVRVGALPPRAPASFAHPRARAFGAPCVVHDGRRRPRRRGMPTRTFASFSAAAAECADSRVRLGWHFRYATDAGLELGRHIARHAAKHALRKLGPGSSQREEVMRGPSAVTVVSCGRKNARANMV